MHSITTQDIHISRLEALWTIFQSQSKSVRQAFTERLLSELSISESHEKERNNSLNDNIQQIDNVLFGSISLPADFNEKTELQSGLTAKYKL